ncbi:MAG: hypothetical protein KDJ52_11770 [Anaerolineae bacterium]|nr:hypothetical protein [Anaerolineae bacterium]
MAKILKSVDFDAKNIVSVRATPILRDSPEPIESIETPVDPTEVDLQEEASNLIAEAQTHVEMMLNQAEIKIERWKEEAQKEGWETGYTQAKQDVEAKLAESLITVRNLAQAAIDAKSQFLKDSEAEIERLTIAIARKIIGKELTVNPKAISDIVVQAIEVADIQGACSIKVNPHDHEILEPLWDAIPSFQSPDNAWQLLADKRVGRGGCMIEVNGGVVNAQIESQLAEVANAFENHNTH